MQRPRPIVCPKCKGEGYLMNRTQQAVLGVFTFGLLPLIDAVFNPDIADSEFSRQCRACDGTGIANPTGGAL